MIFTKQELENLKLDRLIKLANYLGVVGADKMEKDEIVDAIVKMQAPQITNTAPPRYSVRVARIMKQKEKGEL